MPKWSSYITRFLLLMALCILGMTVLFYGMSSYLFNEIYTASNYSALTENITGAGELLQEYQEGKITRAELSAAVNPLLNQTEDFYMLLDQQKQVVAYTEAAAPYFAGDTLPGLLEALKAEGAGIAYNELSGTTALILGQRAEAGYVLAGRPMRLFSSVIFSFNNRLLFYMLGGVLLILFLSTFAARRVARPARLITNMASRLIEGEQVLLPEDLPGQEMQEIAKALNHMTHTVAKAFRDLRYEKETMTLILEGLNEGILAMGEDGAILHENTAARRLLGTPESQAYQRVMQALQEENSEESWEGKFADGARVLFYAITHLPEMEGKESRGTVALIRDITEEERLERTRHDYVANISHELRTPLASIRGLAEGLRDGMVTEEKDRQRYYHIIAEEGNRLARLVNDLLELSSLQSNPAAFEMERVDPNEVIYELHDLNGSLFAEKEISFLRELPEEPLPDIRSNEDRLTQVLTIFLDNARKYTHPGGTVTLGAERAEGGVRFFVRDTGIGMDEETKRMAFERFHQAERGRSDKGSGLGLSIAREILEKLQVTIRVESEPGKGSEFSFVIGEKEKT
ncbi:MAG: HAMP domain-containing protein [Clostridiales bacterium]|nr:HAMP domain-containing protein [Clostridiales bacterium]